MHTADVMAMALVSKTRLLWVNLQSMWGRAAARARERLQSCILRTSSRAWSEHNGVTWWPSVDV